MCIFTCLRRGERYEFVPFDIEKRESLLLKSRFFKNAYIMKTPLAKFYVRETDTETTPMNRHLLVKSKISNELQKIARNR